MTVPVFAASTSISLSGGFSGGSVSDAWENNACALYSRLNVQHGHVNVLSRLYDRRQSSSDLSASVRALPLSLWTSVTSSSRIRYGPIPRREKYTIRSMSFPAETWTWNRRAPKMVNDRLATQRLRLDYIHGTLRASTQVNCVNYNYHINIYSSVLLVESIVHVLRPKIRGHSCSMLPTGKHDIFLHIYIYISYFFTILLREGTCDSSRSNKQH